MSEITVVKKGKVPALVYGILCYLTFLSASFWAIGFIGNIFVPKTIDAGPGASLINAMLIDALLLGMFALQHSVMARPAFKKWWARFIPSSIERSTYVLIASLLLLLLYWQWRPITATVWDSGQTAGGIFLQALYWIGWLIVFLSTFLINHFDLFGLRQVYLNWRGTRYTQVDLKTPILYRLVRHPLMLGFLIVFWSTPHMTIGHLLFAGASTIYILLGISLEEHDLLTTHGEAYRRYQQRVSMLLPIPKNFFHIHKEQ